MVTGSDEMDLVAGVSGVHGVDVVDVARVGRSLRAHGDRFAERVFTAGERAYAAGRGRRSVEHFAVRFAAKEAVLKALGTGWSGGISWTDVEVVRGGSGKPSIVLHGEAGAVAARLEVVDWAVSLSHTETVAMASVIGWIGR